MASKSFESLFVASTRYTKLNSKLIHYGIKSLNLMQREELI